ncbi:MAG: alpha/beta hydrolase, partial [Polyangiales bacterium]
YNNAFKPVRTEYDWLSRDPAEVDKYIADPLCGGDITTEAWVELLGGLSRLEDRSLLAGIPKRLPIYLIAGALDPVGRAGRGPRALADAYTRAGLHDVTLKLYPNARHEMLNETNRDEVTADVIGWLDTRLTRATPA